MPSVASRLAPVMLVAVAIAASGSSLSRQLGLTLDTIEVGALSLSGVKLDWRADGVATIAVADARVGEHRWQGLEVQCAQLRMQTGRIECLDGALGAQDRIPLSFSYDTARKLLDLTLKPGSGEAWRIESGGAGDALRVAVTGGQVQRLKPLLPATVPAPAAGTLAGTLTRSAGRWTADVVIDGLAFSDPAGLKAGERIAVRVAGEAAQQGGIWNWNAALDWSAGEVFWQPLYLRGAAQRLTVVGTTDARETSVSNGRLDVPGIGGVVFEGTLAHADGRLIRGRVRGEGLDVARLYEDVLKAYVQGTALADLRTEGQVSVDMSIAVGAITAVDLTVANLSLEDRQRRYALFGVDGHFPWRSDESTQGRLTLRGGELLRMPFGAIELSVAMRGMRFRLAETAVPMLEGTLTMKGYAAERAATGWTWAFSGDVKDVSMARLSEALGLPTLHGQVSAMVPRVMYGQSTLKVDGALVLSVFDGTVTVSELTLVEPFGRAPRMNADIGMRGIDLDLLTRTFSFGNITGRVEGSVRGLELVNWEPVKFDARIVSAPGDYPRKISQNAVQNISSLGGAGAAAALQRTFLRFFDQFGYDRLGMSCRLTNGVCEMGGVEEAPQGYYLVKGGGVPSISVIGYNRSVNWPELVGRLKRIVQDNVKAVIR